MSKKCNIWLVILLWLILIINLLSLFKKDSALKLETMKVGWSENMKLVEQLYSSESYISQQTAAIEQALAQTTNTQVDPTIDTNTGAEENIESEEINQTIVDQLEEIKSSSVIHGKENARFTILEYSELLCPYCKRHSDQWTIDAVMKKYPSEVNTIFRNFIVHAQAAKLGEAVECVGELKSKVQHDFIKNSFAYEWGLSIEILLDIAWKLWVNKSKLQECVDSGKYTQIISDQTNEWRNLFGVKGTPWNVIIDGETWKFVLIPGAFPVEKFIEEIEKLKSN